MAPLGQMEVGVAPGLDEKQTVSEILMVVQTLPKNQREVIYLKFQCDLSYKEISDITKLSVTNVGFLIHTAVRNIRQQMLSETASQTSRNVRRIQ
jgi:RNA polymerase sigma-70 factor (ECF subfamily)